MSISRFANVFKVMNDEYRTNSKENGEKKLIREDNHFNESIDHDNFVPENKVFTITWFPWKTETGQSFTV